MKRFLCVCLLLALTLSLCACKKEEAETPKTKDPVTVTVEGVDGTSLDFAVCTLLSAVAEGQTTVYQNFNFPENDLEIYAAGEYYKDETLQKSKTITVMGQNYPMYYSITTRPAGYSNEVDSYKTSDGKAVVELIHGTDIVQVANFTEEYRPKMEGDLTQENCIALAKSFLSEDIDEDQWVSEYNDQEFYDVKLVKTLGEFFTKESIYIQFDTEGYVTEIRWENPNMTAAMTDCDYTVADIQKATEAAIEKAYTASEVNPILAVDELSGVTLGVDLDGTIFFEVVVTLQYQVPTAAAAVPTLDLIVSAG